MKGMICLLGLDRKKDHRREEIHSLNICSGFFSMSISYYVKVIMNCANMCNRSLCKILTIHFQGS